MNLSNLKKCVLSLCLVSSLVQSAVAETTLEYPELSVVPRASERLGSEAKAESGRTWQNHIPLLVPATMNFAAGAVLQFSGTEDEIDPSNSGAKYAPWVGMGVGALWWGVTLGLLDRAKPYATASREVSAMPVKTQREQLLRERKAEEEIRAAGRLARRLKYISALSNFVTGLYLADSAQNGEFSKSLAIAAALSSVTPFLFTHRWETIDETQRDYKKRIYGPVVGAAFFPVSTGLVPGVVASLRF